MNRIAILLVGFTLTIFAEIPPNQMTEGFKNGRWWEVCDSTARAYYLIGMADGLSASDANANISAKYSKDPPAKPYNALGWLFPPGTFAEAVKGLDQFYEDPANAAIPIQSALVIFGEKVKGASPEDLAKRTAEARRFANQALEKTPGK